MTDRVALQDRGCELAPSCLQCPLAVCKFDDPAWRRRADLKSRDARIVELRHEGLSVKGIAAAIGVSDRTVYRVLLLDKRGVTNHSGKPSNAPREVEDGPPLTTLDELAEWRTIGDYDFTAEELYQEAA